MFVVCFVFLNSEACIFDFYLEIIENCFWFVFFLFLLFFCFLAKEYFGFSKCQSGQQWRFAPGVLLVVVVLCVVCVYIIYIGGPIEFI